MWRLLLGQPVNDGLRLVVRRVGVACDSTRCMVKMAQELAKET